MTVTLWIAAYLFIGVIVGKLAANAFLNKHYRHLISRIKPEDYNDYQKKNHPTYEEYVLSRKEWAYEEAWDDTSIDRVMSHILGTLFWPAVLAVLLSYYLVLAAQRISGAERGFYLNAAGRDLHKTRKNIDKVIAAKELENKKIEEWNAMVDILNENGLNDVTNYQKKEKVK